MRTDGGHWNEQDFISHVYGVGPEDGHLETCAECRSRWIEVRARRESVTREPEVPLDLLAAQRRSIHRRLGESPRRSARLAPAFAAALLLVFGFVFMRESPPPASPLNTSASDAQLFSDIYALEQSSEPRAVTPIRALFEEN